ncbi:MAG: DNA repair protein RadA, partial [Neisseriaceae bacterium]|nr:DNA repair protein RadA [Neisseriaceae bacterium]
RNKPLKHRTVIFGEIGLSGEIRPVQRGQERLREAEKLGFEYAIIPKANMPKKSNTFRRLKIFGVTSLKEALDYSLADE